MNPIQTNRPVFFGNNGEVLKSGMIYIGQPDQWPLDFPKTVTLQDSAGTQFTAVQPLRTNNQGRITSGGQAVIALVNGDYSMLVRDANGVTVNDGYTPFIANEAEDSEVSGVTQVGLLLSDIKQFDVTPGETVRNVGKLTTLDNLGADWMVVSNTGSPEDDVDLIDFANGAQGKRVTNEKEASVVTYDNTASGLTATDAQSAIDEIADESLGGTGQSWVDVTASRSAGVTYTNSTGRPISVSVIVAVNADTISYLIIDGANRFAAGTTGSSTGYREGVTGIVPDGSSYSVAAAAGSVSVQRWNELR